MPPLLVPAVTPSHGGMSAYGHRRVSLPAQAGIGETQFRRGLGVA